MVDQFKRVRKLCLALPDATEKEAWRRPTFRVRNKMFAAFVDDHHNDGRLAMWCHAPKGKQEVLVAAEPDRFFRPPYLGPKGWLGVMLELVSDGELADHIEEAYRQVGSKKQLARLDEDS